MSRLFLASSSEYLQVDSTPITAVPFTISCWFKPTTNAAGLLVHLLDKSTTNHGFALDYDSDKCRCFTQAGGFSAATSSNSATVGVFNHFFGRQAATDNRESILNGDIANKGVDGSTRVPTGLDRTAIGRAGDTTPGAYINGALAEIGIWNVALSDAENTILSLGGSPILVRPESLVFYMPLIRDADNDLVGGLNFTAFNTPTIVTHTRSIKKYVSPQQFPSAAAPGGWAHDFTGVANANIGKIMGVSLANIDKVTGVA